MQIKRLVMLLRKVRMCAWETEVRRRLFDRIAVVDFGCHVGLLLGSLARVSCSLGGPWYSCSGGRGCDCAYGCA